MTNTDTQIITDSQDVDTETTVDDLEMSTSEQNMQESLTEESLNEMPFQKPEDPIMKKTEKKTTANKRKRNVDDAMLCVLNKNLSEREALMNKLTLPSQPPEDDIDALFKSLAITIKTFPPLLRAQTKNKLFQVISEAELQLLSQPVKQPYQLSDSSYNTSTTNSPLQSPTELQTSTQSPKNWEQQERGMGNFDQQNPNPKNWGQQECMMGNFEQQERRMGNFGQQEPNLTNYFTNYRVDKL